MQKKIENKLLKIQRDAIKANKRDFQTALKETKKVKSFDEFGTCWDGAHYLINSEAKRSYVVRSARLETAKKKNDLLKFKEVFASLIKKKYCSNLKKFGLSWAKVWAAARSAEPVAIGWREVNVGGTKWKTRAAVSGGTNWDAGELSVAYGSCIQGGGYDKPSTATAQALNEIRQALGVALRAKIASGSRCYGLYFDPLRGSLSFQGGVGSGCFERIFEAAGYRSAGISFDGVVNLVK